MDAVNKLSPDAVFVGSEATSGAGVLRYARLAELPLRFVGADAWEAPEIPLAGSTTAYLCTQFLASDPDPNVGRFVTAYSSHFGLRPGSAAALSYDATGILLAAIERAGSLDPVDLAAEIAKTNAHVGATGTITFDELRETRKRASCGMARNHSFSYTTTIAP